MSDYFTNKDNWLGGYYELALETGVRSNELLAAGIKALWQYPALKGCYLEQDREPDDQPRVEPGFDGEHTKLFGIATLPNGRKAACGTIAFAFEDGRGDLLLFYLPMAALGHAYPVGGYPFNEGEVACKAWQKPVDSWLAEIGKHVNQEIQIKLGVIGFEACSTVDAQEVMQKGMPEQRYESYLWPQNGTLQLYPVNAWPLFRIPQAG